MLRFDRCWRYPPQDAETVFQRRVAVCAGYAKFMLVGDRPLSRNS